MSSSMILKIFFTERVVNLVVEALLLNCFKTRLDKFWSTQLNSTQRASVDADVKTPQCPHLSSHYCISIL